MEISSLVLLLSNVGRSTPDSSLSHGVQLHRIVKSSTCILAGGGVLSPILSERAEGLPMTSQKYAEGLDVGRDDGWVLGGTGDFWCRLQNGCDCVICYTLLLSYRVLATYYCAREKGKWCLQFSDWPIFLMRTLICWKSLVDQIESTYSSHMMCS